MCVQINGWLGEASYRTYNVGKTLALPGELELLIQRHLKQLAEVSHPVTITAVLVIILS